MIEGRCGDEPDAQEAGSCTHARHTITLTDTHGGSETGGKNTGRQGDKKKNTVAATVPVPIPQFFTLKRHTERCRPECRQAHHTLL